MDQKKNTSKTWILVAMIMASGVVFLDGTVVNLALPSIENSLGAHLSGLQWIVDGYTLILASLLIPGGSLGDIYGRKKTMVIGLIGFGATSVMCAQSGSVNFLIASRILMGVFGALMVPGSLAIIRAVYTDEEQRGRAVGQWSGWTGIATTMGPLIGGILIGRFSWPYVFLINVPLITATVILIIWKVPESKGSDHGEKSPDWAGSLTVALGLGGVIFGFIQGPVNGWLSPEVIGAFAAGIVFLLFFVFVEQSVRDPMIPMELFRSRNFSTVIFLTIAVFFSLFGTIFFLNIFVQNILEYKPFYAGLVATPISLMMLIFSPIFGDLAGKNGPRLFLSVGPLFIAGGMLLMSRLMPTSHYWPDIFISVLMFGLGLSIAAAPLTDTAISAVPAARSGVASAIRNAASRVGASLAIALMGVVVSTSFANALHHDLGGINLTSQQQQTIMQIAENPTIQIRSLNLPQGAITAVKSSYSTAFHHALYLSASVATLGGITAAIFIRNKEMRAGKNKKE